MLKWLSSHWFIGFVLLGSLLFIYGTEHPLLEQLRFRTFDLYQQIQPRETPPEQMDASVIIIDIDDPSLAAIGQWPWPRNILAQLVDALTKAGALAIGFDIVFAEPDRTSPDRIAENVTGVPENLLKEIRKLPSNDDQFAVSIAKSRVVLGQAGTFRALDGELTRKAGFGFRSSDPDNHVVAYLHHYAGLVGNLKLLEDPAAGLGLFSTIPDEDGIYRKVPLIDRVGEMIYPSLSLELLRIALGGKDSYMISSYPEGGIKEILVKTAFGKPYKIPTDKHGQVWVHFADYTIAPPKYVSVKDVLMPENDEIRDRTAKLLQHSIVLIGTSAVGLKDIRATPINAKLPGVEVHLQVLETILAHAHLTRTDFAIYIEVGMILLGGILMILLVPHLGALYNFLLTNFLIGTQIAIAWYHYTDERLLVDASYPSLCIFIMFSILTYLNYMREERERREVKTAFAHYVSPALLDELADNPEKLALGGETRNISIMFSDIRGFTTISEQFDAEGLTEFINMFLTPMTNVIMEHKGTIDKYMGDAIMAFWNAPLDVPDHARLTCLAALQMQKEVKELNAVLEQKAQEKGRKHIPINIGVGINTGDCCVGNMGSEQRFDYSALGDDVNLASRLEGQSKTYGVDVVLGHNTVKQLGDSMAVIELDLLQVKGKTEPVYIYALMGDDTVKEDAQFQGIVNKNKQLIASYRNQNWDKAEQLAGELSQLKPSLSTLSALYLDRIKEFRRTPPDAEWDGVYVAKSK